MDDLVWNDSEICICNFTGYTFSLQQSEASGYLELNLLEIHRNSKNRAKYNFFVFTIDLVQNFESPKKNVRKLVRSLLSIKKCFNETVFRKEKKTRKKASKQESNYKVLSPSAFFSSKHKFLTVGWLQLWQVSSTLIAS